MEKVKLSYESEDEDRIEYNVIHEDGSKGDVWLSVRDFDDSYCDIRAICENLHLPKGSKVAELFFYPHSETSSGRQGVGSRVLDYVLKDAAKRSIKLVFGEITTSYARNFLQKRGFQGMDEPHCYTVL